MRKLSEFDEKIIWEILCVIDWKQGWVQEQEMVRDKDKSKDRCEDGCKSDSQMRDKDESNE